jgi:hypothetical protein
LKKTTAFTAINAGFSISGALSLLAGVGLLAASASSFQASAEREQITVDLTAWNYLTQIHFDLNRASPLAEAEIRTLQDSQLTFVDAKSVSDKSFAPLIAKRIARRTPAPRNKQAVARVVRAITRPAAPVTTQDRIPAVQAAPIHVPAAKLIETSEDQPQAEAPAPQLEAFQKMHEDLRQRFLTAVNAAPNVTIQVATQAPVETHADETATHEATLARRVYPMIKHRAKPARLIISRPTIPSKRQPPARAAVVAPPVVAPVIATAAASGPVITQANVIETSAIKEVAVAPPAKPRSMDKAYERINELSKAVFAGIEAPQEMTAALAPVSTPPQMATQQMTEATATQEVVQKTASGSSILVGTKGGYSSGTQADYSSSNLFKMWQAWSAREHAAPAPMSRGVLYAQASQPTHDVTRSDVDPNDVYRQVTPVVEAYEWKTAVVDTTSEDVTLEGWKRLRATDHWPVLYWSPNSQARTAMISHNAAVLLAKLADVQLQADAAIVFGKIPAGWNVEFSDRAEKVIYTDETNRLDASSEGARYFTFLNAAPGAQLITLKATLGAETAAVAVPVLNGSSTYLDLTSVSKRPFNGYVLDATAQTRKGVSGAAVSVIGQPNAVFFATESGYFNLSEVYAIGSYPVYAETSTPQGFKHRYRITPGKMENIELFRMSDAQVQGWVSQLEGGVSPDSGMIVAAMPKLTRRYGDGRLFTGTRSLLPNRTLNPETYLISEEGALEAGKPLEIAASRFISVQVPAGPVVSYVEDNNRNVVWSQLVLAQPGVVNVVGPY